MVEKPGKNNALNDEACRRLMEFLFEDEAEAVGDALLRQATAEEEAAIERMNDAGDESARRAVIRLKIAPNNTR